MIEDKIREYQRILNSRETNRTSLDFLLKQMENIAKMFPEDLGIEMMSRLRKMLTVENFAEITLPIYAKYFDEATLDATLAFYKSPAGQRLLDIQEKVAPESQALSAQWGQQVAEQLFKEFNI